MKPGLWIVFTFLLLPMLSLLPVRAREDGTDIISAGGITGYVTDGAGILTAEEQQKLEWEASQIVEEYDFGIYIITVEDYKDYTDGDVFDAARGIYEQYNLGKGENNDGLLLLLSMEDRDYNLMTYGDWGNYAFNDSGRESMTGYFLDDFAEDRWYQGFADYLSWSRDYLVNAQAGIPYSEEYEPMDGRQKTVDTLEKAAVVLGVPLIVAGVVILILNTKMKSVAIATEASAYMTGALQLSGNSDIFTHTTERRRKIEKNKGGGGSSSRRVGRASGTSGKF